MHIPCNRCWPADMPCRQLRPPTCYNTPDSRRLETFSAAIARSAFRTHPSTRPPSRRLPFRAVRPWQRSSSQSTSWYLWSTEAVDDSAGTSGRLGSRCMHPGVLRHHRNATDVTALCPEHIDSGAMYNSNNNAHLTALCLGLPGWAGTRKVKPIWFYWSKRQWVAVASAGPYASLHLAPDR